jgi:hypothetical protein
MRPEPRYQICNYVNFNIAEGHAVGVAVVKGLEYDREDERWVYSIQPRPEYDTPAVALHRERNGELWVNEDELSDID